MSPHGRPSGSQPRLEPTAGQVHRKAGLPLLAAVVAVVVVVGVVVAVAGGPLHCSFGVSAQIGFGLVRDGPKVRFHEGSTSVPRASTRFHEGFTRFCGVVRALKRAPHAVGDIT